MARRYTEAQKAAAARWDAAHVERVAAIVPIGTKKRIADATAGTGESAGAYIRRAIADALQRDEGKGNG